jgi:hypothetical protein
VERVVGVRSEDAERSKRKRFAEQDDLQFDNCYAVSTKKPGLVGLGGNEETNPIEGSE